MLELKKKELEINVYGTQVKLAFPNRLQSKNLRNDLANNLGKEDEVLENFIVSLGMPKDLLDSLHDEDLLAIIKALSPSEKKS